MPLATLRNRYPNFARLTKEGVLMENIERILQPVLIVDDLRGQLQTLTPLSAPNESEAGGLVTTLPGGSLEVPSKPASAMWVLGSTASFANNTGLHTYRLHIGGGVVVPEEIIVTFRTGGVVVGTAAQFGISIWPYAKGAVASAPNFQDQAQWSTSRMASTAINTSYYAKLWRTQASDGEYAPTTTDLPNVDQVARTKWMQAPMPDLYLRKGGAIDLMFRTAVAAGGGLSEINFRVLLSIYST